jgi:hypothetical protein
MAVCPITKETFEPRNPDHVFKNNKAFQLFIERLDPLDEFKVKLIGIRLNARVLNVERNLSPSIRQ